MNELQHLLTQIGSEARLSILGVLRHRALGVLDLSNDLEISSNELVKGLTLLIEAGMIETTESGEFRITGFGVLVWENLASLRYAATNNEFLMTHDISLIPVHLLRNLDRLSSSKIISARSEEFEVVKGYWDNVAGEFSLIADVISPEMATSMRKMTELGVMVRCLVPHEPHAHFINPLKNAISDRYEIRALPQGRMMLQVSKNFTLIGLKKRYGGSDLDHIIVAMDDNSILWSRDLFAYHWVRSKKLS